MKLKNVDPHSPEVTARVLERIRRMTPEEALAYLNRRTPGIEETDMTGMYSRPAERIPAPCHNCAWVKRRLVNRRARRQKASASATSVAFPPFSTD